MQNCMGALRRLSHCCIHTDNLGAYFTLLDGRVPSSNPARARILRRIFRVCFQYDVQVQISWLPSALNAADVFSRPLEYSAQQTLSVSADKHFALPSSRFPVLVLKWLWFRSLFPRP